MIVTETTLGDNKAISFLNAHGTGLDFSKLDSFVIGHLEKGLKTEVLGQVRGNSRGNYNVLVKIPLGLRYPRTEKFKQEWGKGSYKLRVNNQDELMLFVSAHELFHFLALTEQFGDDFWLGSKENTEVNANRFAQVILDKYRMVRSRLDTDFYCYYDHPRHTKCKTQCKNCKEGIQCRP